VEVHALTHYRANSGHRGEYREGVGEDNKHKLSSRCSRSNGISASCSRLCAAVYFHQSTEGGFLHKRELDGAVPSSYSFPSRIHVARSSVSMSINLFPLYDRPFHPVEYFLQYVCFGPIVKLDNWLRRRNGDTQDLEAQHRFRCRKCQRMRRYKPLLWRFICTLVLAVVFSALLLLLMSTHGSGTPPRSFILLPLVYHIYLLLRCTVADVMVCACPLNPITMWFVERLMMHLADLAFCVVYIYALFFCRERSVEYVALALLACIYAGAVVFNVQITNCLEDLISHGREDHHRECDAAGLGEDEILNYR
jgi:hypothetical protein